MANQRSVEFLCVMLLLLSLHSNSPRLASAISCAEMAVQLKSCIPYVFGMAPSPSFSCCKGVSGWRDGAKTARERRKGCLCLKALLRAPGIDVDHVAALPALCRCNIGFAIANSTRCSKAL